jgi:hypothetical protein
MTYIINSDANNQRSLMVHKLAEHLHAIDVTVLSAIELENLPLPKLFSNPGFGDQKRKQPHILGVHKSTGELYIGLVKTEGEDFTDENSRTEYDLYTDLAIRQKGINIYLMLHEDRIQQFNSFITHYLHPDFWEKIMLVAYSDSL